MVSPNAAMQPYRPSAVAVPNPERKPLSIPFDNVRLIQSTAIGPTGAAIENPKTIPFMKKINAIIITSFNIINKL